ncbi:segregation and condensation protein A [Amaricoccus macauensis]|uniref:Segregation and condensation protein A n=1 Tax=Amaricoccus macauensis TaxID=57001 RepID=A0A840SRZ2_9RHOB|nr:ScpA family protein [Amaricoccus macauensis]MBB5223328.1 segregation and condensation protein A [Amaricoccus macauensis]
MPEDFFDADSTAARLAAEALVIDVEGFEGPLDLLLTLARSQKVDLRRISILKLSEQYLGFVEAAKRLRIELAADYLVMAAWLAFLKSRLLLPPDPADEGPSGDDLAAHLAFQLERLEAMRGAAAQLMGRDQLGRDVFARGDTETVRRDVRVTYEASLVDLMRAYARIKTKDDFTPLHFRRGPVFAMEQALERMRGILGTCFGWQELAAWLPEDWLHEGKRRRSATAASFAAALELAKNGALEIRQEGAFAPIWLKPRQDGGLADQRQQDGEAG